MLQSTLDHSIWYYDHEFDCSDWLLYVVRGSVLKRNTCGTYCRILQMESSAAGMGRSLVHGRVSRPSIGSFLTLISGETAVH